MNKRAAWLVAMAAAACPLLLCAAEPAPPPAAIEYRPAPRSTLVSNGGPRFVVAQWQQAAELITVLAIPQSAAAPLPVARLVQRRQDAQTQVAVQRLPETASSAGSAEHQLAVLEQLYVLLLRQEPLARYCLGSGARPCHPAHEGVAHAEVLSALADARRRVAERVSTAVPWRVVEMVETSARSGDADVVRVRAMSSQGPLKDVAIYFNRAPHALCVARTGSDGMAACRLVDQHGDEHEDDEAAPVVATFPGDVRTERVLLPTTYVLPGKP